MFDYNWTTDVLPVIQDYADGGLIKNAVIYLISISLVAYSAKTIIKTFFS